MHEESETVVQKDGKYQNVVGTNRYGERGKPLSPMFSYEKDSYDTADEASHAAEKRSHDFGNVLDGSLGRHQELSDMLRGGYR